jgi:hypothetical protein
VFADTRVMFVRSLKSAVQLAVADGLSVGTGFAIVPPVPSENESVRIGHSIVTDPSPFRFCSSVPPTVTDPPWKPNGDHAGGAAYVTSVWPVSRSLTTPPSRT